MNKTENEKNALLGEMFEKYHGVVLFCILRILGDEDRYMAEDCLSQTFLIACQKKDDLLSRDKPVVWLIAAAKNCARQFKRKAIKEREKTCVIDEPMYSIVDESGEFFVDDIVYRDWIRNKVPQNLINELQPRTREAFLAKYKDGKSNAEIAAEMHITESTVRTFLSDARKYIEDRVNSGKI